MAKRTCGVATGREKYVRPCGSLCCFQGDDIAKFEPVFDGLDRSNLEWKLHESVIGNGIFEQSSGEPRPTPRCTGVSGHLHNDHGAGTERLGQDMESTKYCVEFDILLLAICYADDVVLAAASVAAAEVMVSEVISKLKEVGLTVGAQKTHEFFPDDGHKHHGGRFGRGVGGGFGVCGIDGVSGRECKTCDRTQNRSSQQMSGEMETCVEFSMAPQIVAAEHCKDYDVAGLPLEFECLDDGQGTKRQNSELERENGCECCWSEEATMDGNGSVVETLAQDWSSMDREMQFECAGCHQRPYTQLGWPCGQDGLQRNLCEGSEMSRPSMVAMETAKLERGGERQNGLSLTHNGSKFTDGRTWLLGRCPSSLEMQTVCRQLSRTVRVGCMLLKTVELEAVLKMWKEPCMGVPRGPKRVRHDWDRCKCFCVGRERIWEIVVWRAFGTPLSCKLL